MNKLITKSLAGQCRKEIVPLRPKILFADDEPGIRVICDISLSQAGFNVTTVADGQEAWKALETETFDLLITDNKMPYLTGRELVLKVRQHGLQLPIILAASDLESFLNPSNEWLRVNRLLQKPFQLDQLTETVKQCLQQNC